MADYNEGYVLTVTSLVDSTQLVKEGRLTSKNGILSDIDLSPFPAGDIEFSIVLSPSGKTSSFVTNKSFDSDYQAVLNYATTQGYTLPSEGQQTLQNQLVVDLKDAGVWSKLDAFSVFATDGDSDFALIDWKRLITQTSINSPTFTTNLGYKGNGTSAAIDSLFTPSTDGVNYTLNSASFGLFVYDQPTLDRTIMGVFDGVNTSSVRYKPGLSDEVRINSNNTEFAPNIAYADKLWSAVRTGASSFQAYLDGSSYDSGTSASGGLSTIPFYYLAANGANYSDAGLSLAYMGGDLSAEQADFNTAVKTYVEAVKPTFDADYQAVLDYATAQGYALPSTGQQTLQNQLILDLKNAGVWAKLGSFTMYATDGDFNFALTDWVRLSAKTAVNSPTFTTNVGFTGGGTSQIDWGVAPSGITGYSVGNASFGVGVQTVGSTGFYRYIGSDAVINGIAVNLNKFINSTLVASSSTSAITGLISLTQDGSNSHLYHSGAIQTTVSNSAGSVDTKNFTSFTVTGVSGSSDGTNQYEFAGLDLTSEMGDFETALNTYLTAI